MVCSKAVDRHRLQHYSLICLQGVGAEGPHGQDDERRLNREELQDFLQSHITKAMSERMNGTREFTKTS